MTPQTFIFFGPSGCGKGTQARLMMDALKKKHPDGKILYIETGEKFRKLAEGDSLTAKKVKEILENGDLAPVFLPTWIWAGIMIEDLTGEEHLFLDGMSRKIEEAHVLDSALRFYKRESPCVVSIEASDEWVTKLMKNRGRADDTDKDIKKRLSWFKENTIPAIERFKNDPYYNFISINGEQTIQEVHQEIMTKVGL